MIILSAIWKFICGIGKFILKVFWWFIKGFLNPIGFLIRLIVIGIIIGGIVLLF